MRTYLCEPQLSVDVEPAAASSGNSNAAAIGNLDTAAGSLEPAAVVADTPVLTELTTVVPV